jgi:hypothetical protein
MHYLHRQDKRKLVLFGELAGLGRFCNVEPQRCWRNLTSKN